MEDIQNPNPPQTPEPTPLTPSVQPPTPAPPPATEPVPAPVTPPEQVISVTPATAYPAISKPLNTKSSLLIPGIVSLLVLGLIGGSVYFFFLRTRFSAEEQAALDEARKNNVFMVEGPEEAENVVTSLPKLPQVPDSCKDFANKLEACEVFTCNFKHPFTGEIIKREIIGRLSEDCQYNEGNMNCLLKEPTRMAVAEFYRASTGTSSESNPLEEALNNGECEISPE